MEERKHPFYFKMPTNHKPMEGKGDSTGADAQLNPAGPEFFMERVMDGLTDACLLLDGLDRIIYVNASAKSLLRPAGRSPQGRILGRRLSSVLADRRLSLLAADAYHTGKPIFSRLTIALPGERWRDDSEFHFSMVPLWISATRRLVRLALRAVTREEAEANPKPRQESGLPCSDTMLQVKNPLSIVQGYLENMLDGVISDPAVLRQSLLTMRKHTMAIERLIDGCAKQ